MISEVLFEIAIKRARSVRIVVLVSYEKFKLGLVEFSKVGKIISRVIKQEDAPVFFAFNRFSPPPKLVKRNFYGWSESEKIHEIKKYLEKNCNDIIKAGNVQYKKELKRIYNRIKTNNNDETNEAISDEDDIKKN